MFCPESLTKTLNMRVTGFLFALNEPKPKAVVETISYASIGSSSRYHSIVFMAKRFAHTQNHEHNVTPMPALDSQVFMRKKNDSERLEENSVKSGQNVCSKLHGINFQNFFRHANHGQSNGGNCPFSNAT